MLQSRRQILCHGQREDGSVRQSIWVLDEGLAKRALTDDVRATVAR
jgi:hypothetical protein